MRTQRRPLWSSLRGRLPATAVPLAALILAPLAILEALPTAATARTWYIAADGTGDAPTIQAGIDSAAVGDTVLVGPGTYHENILFRGRDIVLKSETGPETTIIQGSPTVRPTGLKAKAIRLGPDAEGNDRWLGPEAYLGTVVTMENGETRATVLEGFTITGGGHGVVVIRASPIVRGNIVTGNSTVAGGGEGTGILAAGSGTETGPLVIGNTVFDNQAYLVGGGIEGAYMIIDFENNDVFNNIVTHGDGGGVMCTGCKLGSVVSGNRIHGNFAADKGGGIYVEGNEADDFVTIKGNLIWSNGAGGRANKGVAGGGICLALANASVRNNTVVQCAAVGHVNDYGGGIGLWLQGTMVVEDNIIAYSSDGGGIECYGGTTALIRNNLAWQNEGGDGAGECPEWWQSNGNLVADPAFCDTTSGGWSVAANSPALTDPNGPMGAISEPGCQGTAVRPITWGRLKALYR